MNISFQVFTISIWDMYNKILSVIKDLNFFLEKKKEIWEIEPFGAYLFLYCKSNELFLFFLHSDDMKNGLTWLTAERIDDG